MLRSGPARLDDVPAIGGRFGVVDDDRGGGALARGFLELVGPAAIIGHGAAVERTGQARRLIIRVIDQDQHRLALHVQAGIVVPALFRGVDAIADEHHRAVLDLDPGLGGAIGTDHHFRAIGGSDGRLAAGEAQRRDILGGDLDQRHVLEPAALVAGLESQLLELGGQQRQRLFLAHGAGRAAFIGVGRKLLHQPLHRVDRGGGVALGGRGGQRDGGRQGGSGKGENGGDRRDGAAHGGNPCLYGMRLMPSPRAEGKKCRLSQLMHLVSN